MSVELSDARLYISKAYYVLENAKEFVDVKQYMCTEKTIHSEFWPLHRQYCTLKGDLRDALNKFSETAENIIEVIYQMNVLKERDFENKKAEKRELKLVQKAKAMEILREIEKEESDELSPPLQPNDEIYD